MNLKQALYIKTIVEEGGVSAAARKLFVSQPSLSQMLKLMEQEAGVELFERSSYPLRPTYAGECYLHAAYIMLNTQEMLDNELLEIRQENAGCMRLGISMQRAVQVLPSVLPVFQQTYPKVDIKLHEAGSARLEKLVLDGEVDFALASTDASLTNLVYDLIEKETIGLLCGSKSVIAGKTPDGTPIFFEEASEDGFIILKRGHNATVILETLMKKTGFSPKILLETDSLEAARQICAAGPYCMICSDIYMDQDLRKKGACFYPLKDYENHRHFYACYRRGQHLARYSRTFIEYAQDHCQKRRV